MCHSQLDLWSQLSFERVRTHGMLMKHEQLVCNREDIRVVYSSG